MELNITEIQKRIPHRYPFLLVDKIIEIEEGKSAVGIKNVTMNEPFFQGHFPQMPLMPGVLMVEALAQVAGIICGGLEENQGKIGVFTGIDNCKIRRQVVPGDVLRLEVNITAFRRGIVKAEGKAYVGEELACSANLSFAMIAENQ
ncbi:3-hydroxyacyl-ACP dehydratase FabZ [Clostridium formicaceticum]|uniref:3-hydroxyacyl-[acyl-carrier-protein] dehydratase FabZ n=1 Tax=Clostridium formicaceticum TaxID=1497 RepID=A0AAC9WEM1_9CLOT|nr:3-hydroxyacyl-ACP dehydratase FabZ [Clostridium formicaceticum]AOY75596.1 3-hydroxyacyl-[acyl-carrier-protein] dehydratase FabZ [Clostridium formicaceticum]ARE85902.1 3-hydroxyacyl-[acyl-carrier-protein] dehydratase FabZ [Clostridium formicaceticum]